MSYDDDLKKRELGFSSREAAASPNKKFEIKQKAEQQEKKQLAILQQKMERQTLAKDAQKTKAQDVQGVGGLKKEEVLPADAKPDVKRAITVEQLKKQLEQQQGQTENAKKTV